MPGGTRGEWRQVRTGTCLAGSETHQQLVTVFGHRTDACVGDHQRGGFTRKDHAHIDMENSTAVDPDPLVRRDRVSGNDEVDATCVADFLCARHLLFGSDAGKVRVGVIAASQEFTPGQVLVVLADPVNGANL